MKRLAGYAIGAVLAVMVGYLFVADTQADSGKQATTSRVYEGMNINPGVVDTVEWDTRFCSTIGACATFTGDSARVSWDYGYLGHWVAIDSTTWADTAAATTQWVFRRFHNLATSGATNTATFYGLMWPMVRARISNLDEPYSDAGDSSASPDADTLKGVQIQVLCK
jgi:hypothetical protein